LISNSSTHKDQVIASVEVQLKSTVNFTMTNWVFYLSFPEVTVTKAQLKHANMPFDQHVYTPVFQGILSNAAIDYNENHKMGTPIGQIEPQAAMIAGLLKDASISFVADEWLMGGFSMYADKPYTAMGSTNCFDLKTKDDCIKLAYCEWDAKQNVCKFLCNDRECALRGFLQ